MLNAVRKLVFRWYDSLDLSRMSDASYRQMKVSRLCSELVELFERECNDAKFSQS